LSEVVALGAALGPLLVQLPPSLRFDAAVVAAFFSALRARFSGSVVCEPRHVSWFTGEAEQVLVSAQVARAAADPAPVPAAAQPGGWNGLVYHRLHGSPEMYSSDNTALGAATANALGLCARLTHAGQERAVPAGAQQAQTTNSDSTAWERYA
jgi:uncharacterized protein YecE (DUF72 family)